MLERISIKGFRCFTNVEVPLKPLTVLIGANDTGKSVFMEAIHCLALERHIAKEQVTLFEGAPPTKIVGFLAEGEIVLENTLAGAHDSALRDQLRPAEFVNLAEGGILLEGDGYDDSTGIPHFVPSGENVPALCDFLLRRNRRRFEEFVDSAKGSIPGLLDIEIGQPRAARRRLDFCWQGGFTLPSREVSFGIRAMVFYLALPFHPDLPRVLLVEEPENGIHPKRLAEIIGLLRDLSKPRESRTPVQVFLTTHSPYLLDSVSMETDQVLVFRREDDGTRSVEPVDRERLKGFLGEFMLGEIWYNEGEDGLVGKQS